MIIKICEKQSLTPREKRCFSVPNKQDLINILKREEEIRWSEWYQKKCDELKDEPNGWIRLSEQVQYQVVKEFGFVSDMEADIAVNYMRRASQLYPDEEQFKIIPVYVRNNRAKQTKFKEKDPIPNIFIFDLNQKKIGIWSILEKNRVNVLLASSHT